MGGVSDAATDRYRIGPGRPQTALRSATRADRPLVDPAWLYLIAGLALLVATVLIPAFSDVDRTRWERDKALAVERHRLERLARYEAFLAALEQERPAVVRSVVAAQLGRIPAGAQVLPMSDLGHGPAESGWATFASLEPGPVDLPPRREVRSLLARLATGERTRPWLIAVGALSVLVGLLPPQRSRPGSGAGCGT